MEISKVDSGYVMVRTRVESGRNFFGGPRIVPLIGGASGVFNLPPSYSADSTVETTKLTRALAFNMRER